VLGNILNNRYRLDKELGSGGFATVYAGYDLQKRQRVAIKITNDLLSRNSEQLKAFLDELSALARLPRHSYIIGILDYGVVGEKTFLVMDYAPHGTLESLLQRTTPNPLEFRLAGRYFAQMAEALAHAHQHNVVHRDIKPENMLFMEPERLVVSDFGLARQFKSQMTQSINLFGSPPYVAPERWADKVGPASDVYALGIILYQMLTGNLPFQATDPLAYLQLHVYQPAPRLRQFRRDLPLGLDDLLESMLAKQPEQRPLSAELVNRYQYALKQATGYYQTNVQPTKPQSSPPPSVPWRSAGPVRTSGRLPLGADTLPPVPADNSPDVQHWTTAIYNKAGVADNFVKRARAYLKAQTHYKAIADYTEALKLEAGDPQIYYERGNAFSELQQYQNAVADYNQTVKLAPHFPNAYEQRANAYLALGQPSNAITDYEAALRFNSQNPEIYNKRIMAYKQRAGTSLTAKNYREAISDYNQAIEAQPRDARLYKERGDAYAAQEKHRRALADYHQAIRLNLKHSEVYTKLGDVYLEMGQYRKAVKEYNQALKLPGWNVQTYKNRAYAYVCLHKYRQALADYNEAILLNPKEVLLFYQRGQVYFANKDYNKALADFEEALRLDPANLTPLYDRAMCLAVLGHIPDALQTLRYQLSHTKEKELQRILQQAINQLENVTNNLPLQRSRHPFSRF
jgi:serine/threonine protein kinase/regulator of sirC expression with transglutaminase-like and TPR domain